MATISPFHGADVAIGCKILKVGDIMDDFIFLNEEPLSAQTTSLGSVVRKLLSRVISLRMPFLDRVS